MRAKKKRAGFINLALYANTPAGKGFRDVLEGNNGAYKAQKGWDACTGWGSPQQLQKAL
jgi:kumamolisin